MVEIGVHEAKTRFSALLRRVEGGEEVVVTRAGQAVARIVPLDGASSPPDRFGLLATEVVDPGDWEDGGADELGDLFGLPAAPAR